MQKSVSIYTGELSSKASLLKETLTVFDYLASGQSLQEARNEIISANLLNKQAQSTRQTIWEAISKRYFAGRNDESVNLLVQLISSSLSSHAKQLILFYEFCQADQLVYDFVSENLYELYQIGRSSVDKGDVFQWLEKKLKEGHSEIEGWTPQTRDKVASNLLSVARDFGLLSGVQRKSFQSVFVPLSTFIYVLYELSARGLNGRSLVENKTFRLFLLDGQDVLMLLNEANRFGFVKFRHSGDLYDLSLTCSDLKEAMQVVLNTKIS